jgi:CspA family cold shock protein
MPTGKVKFFDDVKGFGFIQSDEGAEVYLHASALPDGMTAVKNGTRIEYSVVDSKRGAQAMSVRILEAPVSLVQASRRNSDDLAAVIQDLIRLLDGLGPQFKGGRRPEPEKARRIAAILRRVADDLDE